MDELVREVVDSFGVTSFGGIGLVAALALLFVLVIVLPSDRRKKARLPFAMLVLHLVLVSLGAAIPDTVVADRLVEVVATFLLLAGTARIVFLLVVDGIFAGRLGKPLPKILRDILQGVVFLFVFMATLRSAGVELASLLTTSALLTAVVGLSLQDTLGNLFAGLSIHAETPFEVGDWIGYDDDPKHVGRVVEINWRATKIISHEEIEITVPNGMLAKCPIRNFSKPSPFARRTIDVGCAYDVSPVRVREVILASLANATEVLPDPPPTVAAADFGPSAIEYHVHFYVSNFVRRFAIESGVRERVWYALKRAKIAIPYPTREVHTHVASDAARAATLAAADAAHVRLLRHVDFLAVLPDAAIQQLAALTETRVYGPGEPVVLQDEVSDELYVVVSGSVSIVLGRAGGSFAEVSRVRAGQFFGEMSFMTGDKRTATVRAVTETELLVVGKAAFGEILKHAPELAEKIAEVLTHRQEQLDEHIAERARKAKPEQDAEAVALLERVKKFFEL